MAAKKNLDSSLWVIPKSAKPDDEVVIYIGPYGFYATGIVKTIPEPRPDWRNRHGAVLTSIKLIEPAISIAAIRRKIPGLKWANYPRSVTTPNSEIAAQIREIITKRRTSGIPDLDDESLKEANIDELRQVALLKSQESVSTKEQKVFYRARSLSIKLYVMKRADGLCEACRKRAPFKKNDGSPYLEPHHTLNLSDDGPDHPSHVIALCPNCHRRAHYSIDAKSFNSKLIKNLEKIETT